MEKKFSKEFLKKDDEELAAYLAFRRRGSRLENKRAYNRKKTKDKDRKEKEKNFHLIFSFPLLTKLKKYDIIIPENQERIDKQWHWIF